jgi:hypothetical protein
MPNYSPKNSRSYKRSGNGKSNSNKDSWRYNDKKQAKQSYISNRFDLLEDDSDLSDVDDKPKDLKNLDILKDLQFSTQPWGDIGK